MKHRVDHTYDEKKRPNKGCRYTRNIGLVVHEKEINDGAGEVFAQCAQSITELGAHSN